MGRRRVDTKQFIRNDVKRRATFNKRHHGVIVKAAELSAMCGARVTLLVQPGENPGPTVVFHSHNEEPLKAPKEIVRLQNTKQAFEWLEQKPKRRKQAIEDVDKISVAEYDLNDFLQLTANDETKVFNVNKGLVVVLANPEVEHPAMPDL